MHYLMQCCTPCILINLERAVSLLHLPDLTDVFTTCGNLTSFTFVEKHGAEDMVFHLGTVMESSCENTTVSDLLHRKGKQKET